MVGVRVIVAIMIGTGFRFSVGAKVRMTFRDSIRDIVRVLGG